MRWSGTLRKKFVSSLVTSRPPAESMPAGTATTRGSRGAVVAGGFALAPTPSPVDDGFVDAEPGAPVAPPPLAPAAPVAGDPPFADPGVVVVSLPSAVSSPAAPACSTVAPDEPDPLRGRNPGATSNPSTTIPT